MNTRSKLFGKGEYVIELGVCKGEFAVEIINRGVAAYVGIDAWRGDRGHDRQQYLNALSTIQKAGQAQGVKTQVVRKSFEDAVRDFPADSADVVYIDGYAHTGQENGKTLRQWWRVVKPGGKLAGHDYCERWPKTVAQVDAFAASLNLPVRVAGVEDRFASWYIVKP